MNATANRNIPTVALNKNLAPLTDGDIQRAVPAAFSKTPIAEVSQRYGFISTADMINGLRDSGFVPVEAKSYHKRANNERQFAKHLIKFRPAGDIKKVQVGEVVPQVVLTNSHDRSTRFSMLGGLFRLVCTNGLIVPFGTAAEPVNVRHTANMVDEVILQAGMLIQHAAETTSVIDEMLKFKLSPQQQNVFAERVLEGLMPRGEDTPRALVKPELLLQSRRPEDNGDDLWHVFNRVQENVMRGGLEATSRLGRRVVTRPINAIDSDLRFNTHAWIQAMELLGRVSGVAAVKPKKSAGTTEEIMADLV